MADHGDGDDVVFIGVISFHFLPVSLGPEDIAQRVHDVRPERGEGDGVSMVHVFGVRTEAEAEGGGRTPPFFVFLLVR